MKRKVLGIITIVVVIIAIYWVLGIFGLVPILHCNSTIGPSGAVNSCDWRSGSSQTY